MRAGSEKGEPKQGNNKCARRAAGSISPAVSIEAREMHSNDLTYRYLSRARYHGTLVRSYTAL